MFRASHHLAATFVVGALASLSACGSSESPPDVPLSRTSSGDTVIPAARPNTPLARTTPGDIERALVRERLVAAHDIIAVRIEDSSPRPALTALVLTCDGSAPKFARDEVGRVVAYHVVAEYPSGTPSCADCVEYAQLTFAVNLPAGAEWGGTRTVTYVPSSIPECAMPQSSGCSQTD